MDNVVIVVMDAVRYDRLSCYGYCRKTTQFIDKLADDGIKFNKAYSTHSFTFNSHFALFTGINDENFPRGNKLAKYLNVNKEFFGMEFIQLF